MNVRDYTLLKLSLIGGEDLTVKTFQEQAKEINKKRYLPEAKRRRMLLGLRDIFGVFGLGVVALEASADESHPMGRPGRYQDAPSVGLFDNRVTSVPVSAPNAK